MVGWACTVADLVVSRQPDPTFWSKRRVLLTGHTGFKGSWTALWLNRMGADVVGLALPPEQGRSLYTQARVEDLVLSDLVDLRNREALSGLLGQHSFDVVLHMAAQPLVRTAIADPVGTFATNVIGTANLLDALRWQTALGAVLAVTTDKVYANDDSGRAFIESDRLGGKDPYAASKAGAELVCASFAQSYFERAGVPVATARGGNVIGGGDYSRDRLVADLIRSVEGGEQPRLRHPDSTRPWQHVLDCVAGYLVYLERLCANPETPRALNFGPRTGSEPVSVAALADAVLRAAGSARGWTHEPDPTSIEAQALAIDTSLASASLDFESRLVPQEAVDWTVEWHRAVWSGEDAREAALAQIVRYEGLSC